MRKNSSSIGWRCRRPIALLGLALLVAGCVSCVAKTRVVCTPQGIEALREIAEGHLDNCAPAVAAWERELARDCGWIEREDFYDPDPR